MNEKQDSWAVRIVKRKVSFSLTLVLLVVVVGLVFGPMAMARMKVLFAWEKVQATTLTMLSSEKLRFLVTDKLVTQVMITKESTGARRVLLGNDTDIMSTVVTLYYGVDLEKITKASIRRSSAGEVVITIPDPEVLDVKVHEHETKVIQKQSGLTQLLEVLGNNEMERLQALRVAAEEDARAFFEKQGQLPSREDVVKDLNEFSFVLSEQLGVAVRFE